MVQYAMVIIAYTQQVLEIYLEPKQIVQKAYKLILKKEIQMKVGYRPLNVT